MYRNEYRPTYWFFKLSYINISISLKYTVSSGNILHSCFSSVLELGKQTEKQMSSLMLLSWLPGPGQPAPGWQLKDEYPVSTIWWL